MRREDVADLAAFAAVAEEGSFTRAASRLQISQSALSQIVRRLEERLGMRLLARTTRSVAPTKAGEKLIDTLAPMLRDLEERLATLSDEKDRPSGTITITTVEHAARMFMVPALGRFLPEHPEITVEMDIDFGLTDIVASRFDAGVRLGEQVEKDMIAVRISPPIPMAIVGSPDYFARIPEPQHPRQLRAHRCLNLRMPTSGDFYDWRLSNGGKAIHVRLEGQLVFNALGPILDAALAGLGVANLPLDQADEHIRAGSLIQVLADWSEQLPAYHLYYPHRRHSSTAFKLVVDALRYRD
jgi:LysR family transcriptional regulator, regulator of peptidoglycan recycling